jgi:hypothetical protein
MSDELEDFAAPNCPRGLIPMILAGNGEQGTGCARNADSLDSPDTDMV